MSELCRKYKWRERFIEGGKARHAGRLICGKWQIRAENEQLKKFIIFGQEFRNSLKHYDSMTDIVSGLVKLQDIGKQRTAPLLSLTETIQPRRVSIVLFSLQKVMRA